MKLILTLAALAVFAVLSVSMTASATSADVEPAALASEDVASVDCEAVEPDFDSSQCWADGTACSIYNDQCCGSCQVLIGHAGRCAFGAAP